jgi:CBS domain-containing protein
VIRSEQPHAPLRPSPLRGIDVADAMHREVITCSADDDRATVAGILVRHDIHAVLLEPIERANPAIVTDRDLLRAVLDPSSERRASEFARDAVTTLPGDASLDDAVAIMAKRLTRHLLITDTRSGAPAGVLSSFDVVALLGDNAPGGGRRRGPVSTRSAPIARSLPAVAVGDVMHAEIATCAADASMHAVAHAMAEQHVRCLAVAGIERAGQHLIWGLIDDLDVVAAQHRGALSEPAVSIAARSPIAVRERDSLYRAAELMVEHDASHVVVVGRAGLPIGIVSSLDVASVLAARPESPTT